tara:strand:- start:2149 stop:2373 length:225 start_codon:yes stop_codon:yes gene_type:complete
MNTIYDLNINSSAIITTLNNSSVVCHRLSELGILPGAKVRLINKAPFGGPIQIKLNHSYLVIRKEDAILINVDC